MLYNFWGSLLVLSLGVTLSWVVGGPQAILVVLVLCVLEVSISFENAIVNASVLKTMETRWQSRFLTWGMLIAVFGVRILLPVLLVSAMTSLSPWTVLDSALNRPDEYGNYLHESHGMIASFGGMFLFMVFLKFFLMKKRR